MTQNFPQRHGAAWYCHFGVLISFVVNNSTNFNIQIETSMPGVHPLLLPSLLADDNTNNHNKIQIIQTPMAGQKTT